MSTDDIRIGANIRRLRGDDSQQWLADEMRKAGHKWAQATVWSVEKGERPLRLTEAATLMLILGKDPRSMARLIESEEESILNSATGQLARRAVALKEAFNAYLDQREAALTLLQDATFDWEKVAPERLDRARWEIDQMPEDLVDLFRKWREERGSDG